MRVSLARAIGPGLCAALLLAACAEEEPRPVLMAAPPQSTSLGSPAETFSAGTLSDPEPADEAMVLSTVITALSGSYAGNENGCYTVATYNDGSADVLYFDYAARTMTLLEHPEKPDEALQGRIAGCRAGVTPMTWQDRLYLFKLSGAADPAPTNGDGACAAVTRLDADGANPTTLAFPAGWSFVLSGCVLTDGGNFYFLMRDEADAATLLVRMDTDATAYEALCRYEPGYEYSIEGYWEKGPLLVEASPLPPHGDPEFNIYWENREFRLLAQGMNTGRTEELKTWRQGVSTSTQGSVFYFWNPEDDSLYALDADTGKETLVAGGFAPEGYVQAQLMRTLLNGKLRVQFSTSGYVRDYRVDPATGEAVQTPVENLGDNVTVCAESGYGILVRDGEHWVAAAKVPDFITGASPSPTNPDWVSMPTYALIDAESYWSGRQNFADIQDLVYD